MTGDDLIVDREMAFAHQHHDDYTCGDLHPDFRECRRAHGHKGDHAAGYGAGRVWWT